MTGEANGQASAVAQIHARLREGILSGDYAPGSRLVLARLAEEHGVSIIPVREALRTLEAERLVVVEPNRGATVTPVSAEDVRDVYATRVPLERHALLAAMAKLDDATLEVAGKELDAMADDFRNRQDLAALEHHRRFHFALYDAGSSPWTMHLIEQLWQSAERYLRLAPRARSSLDKFVAEHRAILEAVRAGRADQAAERLEFNLQTTANLLADQYGPAKAPAGE